MSVFLQSLDFKTLLDRLETEYAYTLRYKGGYGTDRCTTHSFYLKPIERSES